MPSRENFMRLVSTSKQHSNELLDEDCSILLRVSTDTSRCCFRPLPDMLSLCEIEAERNALWPQRPMLLWWATPFTTRHPHSGGVMQDKEITHFLDRLCSLVLKWLPMLLPPCIPCMYFLFALHITSRVVVRAKTHERARSLHAKGDAGRHL